MAKFLISETVHQEKVHTVRLGTATDKYGDKEIGKAVKLSGESAYVLCALGDTIEGIVQSSNLASQGTVDGFAIGGIYRTGYKQVTLDGSQAAGTGVIAVGDYVVVGTVTAFGTAQSGPLKVRKATDQAVAASAPYKARVVSLGAVGTGAVGTVGVVELF